MHARGDVPHRWERIYVKVKALESTDDLLGLFRSGLDEPLVVLFEVVDQLLILEFFYFKSFGVEALLLELILVHFFLLLLVALFLGLLLLGHQRLEIELAKQRALGLGRFLDRFAIAHAHHRAADVADHRAGLA